MGIVTIDLDACLGSTPLLEGKQDINLPIAGSEKHAVLSILLTFHFHLPQLKPMCMTCHVEMALPPSSASLMIAPHKNMKPPALSAEDLEKSEEVPIRGTHLSSLADQRPWPSWACIRRHSYEDQPTRGISNLRMLKHTNEKEHHCQGTTRIKLAGGTEMATAEKCEAVGAQSVW